MPNKNVNILLKLQDQFTKPMRECGVITKDQEKAMRRTSQSVIGFSRNVRNGFLGGVKHVAKFGAALTGITGVLSVGALKAFASQSEELAKAQIDAETKLEAVLGNVKSIAAGGTEAIAAAKSELMSVASDIQRVGVIGDEVTLAGMQQLATFQLSADQIATLSTGMTDLLAQQKGLNASQEDAVSIANLIGKAMNGNAGALTRVGIIMTDNQKKMLQTGDATQRAAVLAEILQDNVGGVNAALADTSQGKIQQFQNAWGDMKEEVGKHILDLKAEIAGNLVGYIPRIQEVAVGVTQRVSGYVQRAVGWVRDHSEQIKTAVLSIRDGVATAWGYIKPVLGFAVQHANTLIPLTLKVVAAISAISIAADVAGAVMGLTTAMKTFGLAVKGSTLVTTQLIPSLKMMRMGFKASVQAAGGLGAALRALALNPIGLVITGVAAATAGFIYLWNHSEKFRNGVKKVGEGLVAFGKIAMSVFEPIVSLVNAISSGMEKLGFSGSSWGTNTVGYMSRREYNATGTPFWKGGPTYVNEGRRGEIINLPSGTQIIPHDVSMAAAQGGGGRNVTVNVNIAGNVLGNRQYAEELGRYVADKVMKAWEVTA